MTINFDKMENLIQAQGNGNSKKDFVEFSSKKKLIESGLLNSTQAKYIEDLKNVYMMAVHEGNKYMGIAVYITKEKTTHYFIVQLADMGIAKVENMKTAKSTIREIMEAENAAILAAEAAKENAEKAAQENAEVKPVEEPKPAASRSKSSKK